MDRPLFRRTLETQAVVKVLSDDAHDKTFTYEELSEAAKVDVRKHRGCLQSAMRIVQNEKGLVFECIPNVGIVRADDATIVSGRTRDLSRIRSTARRGIKKLECIKNVAELSADKRTQFNVLASGLGVIAHATTARAQGAIEQIVIKEKNKLPVAETLAALGVK